MRLFDFGSDTWVNVVVDSYIPCNRKEWWRKQARPLFSKPNGNELWPLIVEK